VSPRRHGHREALIIHAADCARGSAGGGTSGLGDDDDDDDGAE
jgi:hypothetical protein